MANEKKKLDKEAKQWIVSTCIARHISLVYCKEFEGKCQLNVLSHSGSDNIAGHYDVTVQAMNDFLESVYDRMNGYKAKDFSDLTVE